MARGNFTRKSDFTFKHTAQVDEPSFASPTVLKTNLDSQSKELRDYTNDTLLSELEANTDKATSGAKKVGINSTFGDNIQEAIDSIEAAGTGTVPANNSITPAKATNDLFFLDQNYFTTTNSGNNYVISTGRSLASLTAGMEFKIKINANSTGNITLNVDGIGALNVLKSNTENVSEIFENSVYTVVYNGTNFILQGEGGLGSFFGDGSDGVLNTSGNVTLTSTLNGAAVVKQYESITINAGHTLTVSNPNQGLILYSKGDVVIDGTIDMSKKAGLVPNSNIIPMLVTKVDSTDAKTIDKYFKLTTSLQSLKGGAGGNGGNGGSGTMNNYSCYGGTGGNGGTGRTNLGGFGGGGGGGATISADGINTSDDEYNKGGSITYSELGGGTNLFSQRTKNSYGAGAWCFVNGSNGAGGITFSLSTQSNTYLTLSGGQCLGGGGGGAVGYATTTNSFNGSNGEYAGGFIMIICGGNVIINSGGYIKANGGNGGNGGGDSTSGLIIGSGGGGGSGGGVIASYYKGSYTNNGTVQVNGGSGGLAGASGFPGGTILSTGSAGTSGSSGTIHTQKI